MDKETSQADARADTEQLYASVQALLDSMSQVVLGKRDVSALCLVALLSGEHVLLEDVPGVGKTLMGKALARSVSAEFCRVQFTPDLLPSDIVGSSIFNSNTNSFEFVAGPIFNSFVLADEINRAPPRTQSALLEAMSDGQVSVDGKTHALDKPFMVIATQNPYEFEGTYILPESQMDRFLLRISMGYPEREYERQILESHRLGQPVEEMKAVCTTQDILNIQKAVRKVTVEESISEYMLDVIRATRESSQFSVGVSTRGALLWYRATQANAFIAGRDFAIPDDAKDLAVPVLSHRVQLHGVMQGNSRTELESVLREVVSKIPIPV
ncbi:MAG: MoxR family ATPase [Mariniblastus sp.]|nr:MoxR family ATPase [Mariniblastus sp.]